MTLQYVRWIFAGIILIWAAITDVKWYKIKNYTVLTGIIGGLALNYSSIKSSSSLLGMVAPLLLLVLFAVGMMGAGDIKLFCALGAILGMPEIVNVVLYSFILSALLLVLSALIQKRGKRMLHEVMTDIAASFRLGKIIIGENRLRIPMAVATFAATMIVVAQRITDTSWIYLF